MRIWVRAAKLELMPQQSSDDAMMSALRLYLDLRGSRYTPTKQIEGTYGLVFVMETAETNVFPARWCAKTINPEKFSNKRDIVALFKREMRLWLNIPPHYHVCPALGLDFMRPPREFESQFEMVPLVRMPYCENNLSDWVKNQEVVPMVDRLIALAQVCSGLHWLYKHGLQGHGDLKPDNVLVEDRRNGYELPEYGFPSTLHPWQARVTDLGWADIWCQGGGTYHAWRPYLAPERFRNTVVPEASDIYALGVIACELLSGVHPGGDKTEVLARKWNNPKRWESWAGSTDRVVNVQPSHLRDVILRCLSPEPTDRPRVADLMAVLCDLIHDTHSLEVAWQLQAQEEAAQGFDLVTHGPWVAEEMARVSPNELDVSIDKLEAAVRGVKYATSSPDEIAQWLANGASLQRLLLRRNGPDDISRAAELATATLDFILQDGRQIDLRTQVWGKSAVGILRPEEIPFQFAFDAFAVLLRAKGGDLRTIHEYKA